MNGSQKTPNWQMNERGFTMAELLVGSAISLILLALVAGIIQPQSGVLSRQSQLGQMQANGRAVLDFISRSSRNAGFNVTRGKKFLAASDHYVTMVFDDDNDDVIQNDEVMTYAISNPDDSTTDTFTISPFFDDDSNGTVEGTETRGYAITLGLQNPPFHFYRITPDQGSSSVTKSTVARNIDNLIIRYWDKNGDPLPAGVEIDEDTGDPIPPYVIPASELNDIRQLEVEVVTRSRDKDPNSSYLNSDTYLAGSAATRGGTTRYSDHYHRATLKAVTFPRNSATAPWGKINMTANPPLISCRDNTPTIITATVVDGDGDGVGAGTTVTFNTSEGTLDPASGATIGTGNATTVLTYDWEQPSVTATVSASALIDVDGEDRPVFSAIPVSFESGTGIFTDGFDDNNSGWTEEGVGDWEVTDDGKYKTASNGFGLSLNGCAAWQDYEAQVDIQRNGSLGKDEYVGLIVRYQDPDQYYSATPYCTICTGNPNNNTHALVLERYDSAGNPTTLKSTPATFDLGDDYTLKASVDGDEFKAKFRKTGEKGPADWDITATDSSYTSGAIALTTTQSQTTFDNVAVNPIS